MLLHAGWHGAQAAQSEEHIIRADAETDIAMHALQLGEVIAFGRNSAEQGVGMADNIFGGRENGEINTEIERSEIERRRPCIINSSFDTGFFRRCDNGRHVLHFKGLRAGAFHENHRRIVANELGNIAADERVVIFRLNAIIAQ